MASKDQEKKEEAKDQKTKKSQASGKDSGKTKDEKNSGDSKRVKEKLDAKTGEDRTTMQESGHSWGGETPPVSGPGKRTVEVNRYQKRRSTSSESKENFFSNLNINTNYILGAAGAVAGGALLFRGVRGEWPFNKKNLEEVKLHSKVTINASKKELYAYWRKLENLPNFMSHLEEVEEIDQRRSRWTAEIPGGLGTINWEAVIDEDRENEFLSWKSLPGAEIENAGEVRFKDVPGGKGTIVETTISYRPPAGGELGEKAMKLFNPAFEKTVKRDLKQFKKHMEKGDAKKRKSKPAGKILY